MFKKLSLAAAAALSMTAGALVQWLGEAGLRQVPRRSA